jgi:hypothetical protein
VFAFSILTAHDVCFQRFVLEARFNEIDACAQQLHQELDSKLEAIEIIKQEVCMKSVDAE